MLPGKKRQQKIRAKLKSAYERIAREEGLEADLIEVIAKGVTPNRIERMIRKRTIVKLRGQGLTNAQMADVLGMSVETVNHLIVELIAEGRLDPGMPGPRPT